MSGFGNLLSSLIGGVGKLASSASKNVPTTGQSVYDNARNAGASTGRARYMAQQAEPQTITPSQRTEPSNPFKQMLQTISRYSQEESPQQSYVPQQSAPQIGSSKGSSSGKISSNSDNKKTSESMFKNSEGGKARKQAPWMNAINKSDIPDPLKEILKANGLVATLNTAAPEWAFNPELNPDTVEPIDFSEGNAMPSAEQKSQLTQGEQEQVQKDTAQGFANTVMAASSAIPSLSNLATSVERELGKKAGKKASKKAAKATEKTVEEAVEQSGKEVPKKPTHEMSGAAKNIWDEVFENAAKTNESVAASEARIAEANGNQINPAAIKWAENKAEKTIGKGKDARLFSGALDDASLANTLKSMSPEQQALAERLTENASKNGQILTNADLDRILRLTTRANRRTGMAPGVAGGGFGTIALGAGLAGESGFLPDLSGVAPASENSKKVINPDDPEAGKHPYDEDEMDAAPPGWTGRQLDQKYYGYTPSEISDLWEDQLIDAALNDPGYRSAWEKAGYSDLYNNYVALTSLGDSTDYEDKREVFKDILGLDPENSDLEIQGLQQLFKEAGVINDKMSNEEKLEAVLQKQFVDNLIDPYQWMGDTEYAAANPFSGDELAKKEMEYWRESNMMPILDELVNGLGENSEEFTVEDVMRLANAWNIANQMDYGTQFDPSFWGGEGGFLSEEDQWKWLDRGGTDEEGYTSNVWKPRYQNYSLPDIGNMIQAVYENPKDARYYEDLIEYRDNIDDYLALVAESNDKQKRRVGYKQS